MRQDIPFTLCILLVASTAHGDRGALSVDVGGGGSGVLLPPPAPAGFVLVSGPTELVTSSFVTLGARFALSNHIELTAFAFYDPPVTVFHNGVLLESTSPLSSFPGTLVVQYSRFGALGGARLVWGSERRLSVSCELGWARRLSASLVHYDDHDPNNAVDYDLPLHNLAVDSAVISAGPGIEWAFGDKMSIAVLPRIQFMVGPGVVIAVSVPVVFSYSWFL